MTRRLLILFLALGMTLHVSGCSSSGTQEEGDVATANEESFAEEGEGDFAEEPVDDGGSEIAAEEGGTEEAAPSDSGEVASEEGGGEDELSLDDEQSVADNGEAAPPAAESGDELSLDDEALPEDIATNEAPPAEPAPPVAAEPPPTDEPVFAGGDESTNIAEEPVAPAPEETTPTDVASSSTGMTDTAPTDTAPAAAPAFVPVVKIKDAAFNRNGTLLNRVYLARPGDNLKGVSKKIYGDESHSKQLASWNANLKRGVKTGDKVYYASPRDPNDTRMLTYYEDAGLQPSTYVSKEGDNIRKVSKQLLGSSESWKEVWATNMNVESKGDIPAGIELRYWPDDSGAAPAPMLAGGPQAGAPPTDSSMGGMPPGMEGGMPPGDMSGQPMAGNAPPGQDSMGMPPTDVGSVPPPPPPAGDPMHDPMAPSMAANDPLAPPGPGPASTPDTGAAGTVGANDPLAPPPPPPPMEPPAPPRPAKKAAAPPEVAPSSDPDTIMAIGFGGILLIAAAVLFVVIRKNRAKRMDLGQTQV